MRIRILPFLAFLLLGVLNPACGVVAPAPHTPIKPLTLASTQTSPIIAPAVTAAPTATSPLFLAPPTPIRLQVLDLTFLDMQHGWLLGMDYSQATGALDLRATSDGGDTWHEVSRPPSKAHVGSIAFENAWDGWAFHPGLYSTHDGGLTWQDEHPKGRVVSIQIVNSSVWALERTGCAKNRCDLNLLALADSGKSWQSARLPTGTQIESAQLVRQGEQQAWILYDQDEFHHGLMATRDGGKTWSEVRSLQDQDFGVGCELAAGAGQLWLSCGGIPSAGQEAKWMYRSADNGSHWHRFGDPNDMTAGYSAGLAVVSPQRVFAAFDRDTLLRTDDGGKTWETTIDPNSLVIGISDVLFVDSAHGWAFSEYDAFRTSDGGMTWQRLRFY